MEYNLRSTASIGRRFVAYVLDVLPLLIIVVLFTKRFLHLNVLDQNLLKENPKQFYEIQELVRYTLFGLWVLVSFLLEQSTWQGTWGKRIMGIKVVNGYGEPLTTQQSIQRNLVKILSMLLFGIGFFWIAFNRNRSGWYDIAAKTKVVHWEN
ncbi:MAG: hypothetical protein RL607_2533 [Bacteroidota bacterium]|jgi:uncharacterized RDD family membrane protein YckC